MTTDIQSVKQRFGIIGNNPKLNHAIQRAIRVAPTDISVLVTGESGTGKETIPKIIHHFSHRKHGPYFAINCGAIPEGTIDSELFGHEKGAFTGATGTRKGYFEVANGGTLFLDEVGELPLTTQVRLLRVLETGEFIKVGSSKVEKTDVRIVAATNKDLRRLVEEGKFREDLYYRLNTVEIPLPPLRERGDDVILLFRKFASDFAYKYHTPPVRLTPEAQEMLKKYHWPGNIRELRNLVEQMSILEETRTITPEILRKYLPDYKRNLPEVVAGEKARFDFDKDRELIFKFLFELKKDVDRLKTVVNDLVNSGQPALNAPADTKPEKVVSIEAPPARPDDAKVEEPAYTIVEEHKPAEVAEEKKEEETLSLVEKEKDLIKKALEKHNGRRKPAAKELGISERTLYRKIKQYNLR
ncbi:MAG: sigma-54-dependent Fis family transcriptional regulator [Chlorobi bacterium]|nr:sigma-54-dependent Fis family transcriptional regulator [Chlorobiota bacterium]